MNEEPPLKNNSTIFEEPHDSGFFDSRDTRSTAPFLFWNLHGAGAGVSRGIIISVLRSDLYPRCFSDPDPVD